MSLFLVYIGWVSHTNTTSSLFQEILLKILHFINSEWVEWLCSQNTPKGYSGHVSPDWLKPECHVSPDWLKSADRHWQQVLFSQSFIVLTQKISPFISFNHTIIMEETSLDSTKTFTELFLDKQFCSWDIIFQF